MPDCRKDFQRLTTGPFNNLQTQSALLCFAQRQSRYFGTMTEGWLSELLTQLDNFYFFVADT
jgi:hypothetical protein